MKKTAAILLMAVMMLTNERQKQEILEMNQEFIDDALEDFQEENSQ